MSLNAVEFRAQNILVIMDCAIPRVWYPHRKTPDIYVGVAGSPLRCLQCELDVLVGDVVHHIRSHGKQSRKKPIIITDGTNLWHVEVSDGKS